MLAQAAALFPKSAHIRVLLGVAYYAVGQFDDAETALTDAIGLDPALEPAYGYLARSRWNALRSRRAAVEALCRQDQVVCAG